EMVTGLAQGAFLQGVELHQLTRLGGLLAALALGPAPGGGEAASPLPAPGRADRLDDAARDELGDAPAHGGGAHRHTVSGEGQGQLLLAHGPLPPELLDQGTHGATHGSGSAAPVAAPTVREGPGAAPPQPVPPPVVARATHPSHRT